MSNTSYFPAVASTSWRGDVLALISGAILPLAFSPFDISLVALLAPAALFFLWLQASPRRALWRGLLFGLGMFGVGVTWIYISIHEFGGVSLPLSIFLMSLFVVVLAWFPALCGYFVTRFFTASAPLKLLLVFPAAWTLFEWIRGWFLTGFPWLYLGHSQIDMPLAGLAPVLGVYGVSWAMAFSAGLVVMALLDTRGILSKLRYIAVLAIIWITAGLLNMQQWTQPVGPPLKASLIQGNIAQDVKWTPDVLVPTLELYLRLTRGHWDSDLIVWPETALPLFYHEAKPFVDGLQKEARENGADILLGLPVLDERTQRYYNSMMSVGSHAAFYHKSHLVPFTEYLPLKNILAGVVDFLQVPMSDFSKGSVDQRPLAVAGQKAAISICYEAVFGEEVIRQLPEATLLVNVSNDAWFGGSIGPHQHLQITRMRALETGRPLLRATNTGITAIIAPNGKLQARAKQFEAQVLTGTIQPMGGATPYVRTGNLPVVVMLAVVLGLGIWVGRRVN
jgi:apolipoprotein N-acyltransferase